jgi:hypothetical protein
MKTFIGIAISVFLLKLIRDGTIQLDTFMATIVGFIFGLIAMVILQENFNKFKCAGPLGGVGDLFLMICSSIAGGSLMMAISMFYHGRIIWPILALLVMIVAIYPIATN